VAHQEDKRTLRRLLQHFEQRVGARRVELIDGIDDGDAPAPFPRCRAEESHGAADVIDRNLFVQYALVVERALDDKKIGLALRGDPARHRIVRGDGERFHRLHFTTRRIGMRQHEAGRPVGKRRLADAFRAGNQEGMRNTAAAISRQQCRLGIAVAEQRLGFARMPRLTVVFVLFRAHG
jgi:hypothetical protein